MKHIKTDVPSHDYNPKTDWIDSMFYCGIVVCLVTGVIIAII